MDGIPALTLWDLRLKYFVPYRTELMAQERVRGKPVCSCQVKHAEPDQAHQRHSTKYNASTIVQSRNAMHG